jgi:hypothetical protein
MIPNIYLDIDGVLLDEGLQAAHYANEFLRYVLDEYPDTTYWLTTHCNGDASVPVQHIGHLFEPDVRKLMVKIKPTSWQTAKTRGIDFTKPFLWFDDNLFYEEKETLLAHDALDSWIKVDLTKDQDYLGKILTSFPIPISLL